MRPTPQLKVLDGRRTAEREGLDVMQFQEPAGRAAPFSLPARSSSHAALRRGHQWRSPGRWAGSFTLDDRELERQMSAIATCRARVVADLHVQKPLLSHHVPEDFLEATQRLALQGPAKAQLSAVRAEAFVEFLPSGSGHVEVFRANDLNARHDVMALYRYALNASQPALLTAEHDRPGEE